MIPTDFVEIGDRIQMNIMETYKLNVEEGLLKHSFEYANQFNHHHRYLKDNEDNHLLDSYGTKSEYEVHHWYR